MEALRGFLVKRERYKPPQPVLPWVPACEYQVVITVALLAMAGAYFALLNSIFQYFFGIHNKRAIDIVHSPNSSTSDQDDTELELEISDDHTKQPKNFEYRAYYCNMHLIINGVIPVFFAQGMLMFRVWCCYNRKIVKILHVIVLGITLPLGVLSLPFMSRWSNYLPSPVNGEHFWSLHAWMGMLFILLFAITFVSGIYIFFWKPYKDPYGSAELRSKFVPYHSFMGVALFIIAISQVVTGLTNYASAFTWEKHSCEECIEDIEICSSWNGYILTIGLSFLFAVLGYFLIGYWSYRWGLGAGQTLTADSEEDEILKNTYSHAMWSLLAYIIINAIGVLAFRICCIFHPKVSVAFHIISFAATLLMSIVAYGYAGSAQRLNTERPLGGRTIYGVHAILGLAVMFSFLLEFLQGFILLFWKGGRRVCGEIHKAMGVAIYALTLMTLVAAFTHQQTGRVGQASPNPSSDGKYMGTPWTQDHKILMAGSLLTIFAFFIIIFILLRQEINVHHTVIVPDDEILMLPQ